MRNCREFCPYREICKKHYPRCTGEEGLSHSECPIAWKIEDILMDARDICREQGDPDEIPFCEDYDGPETEEL